MESASRNFKNKESDMCQQLSKVHTNMYISNIISHYRNCVIYILTKINFFYKLEYK